MENAENFWSNLRDTSSTQFEPTDEEQVFLDKLDKLPYYQRYLITESYDKSLREIAKEFEGINQNASPEFWDYHQKYGIKTKPTAEQVRYMNPEELSVYSKIDWERKEKNQESYMTPLDKINLFVEAIKHVHRTVPRTEEEWKEGKKAIGKYKKEIERLERVIDKNNTYKQNNTTFDKKEDSEEGMKYLMISAPTEAGNEVNLNWLDSKDFDNDIETSILDSYRPFKFVEDDKRKSYIIVERNGRKISFEALKNEICEATFTKTGTLRRKLRQFSQYDDK